MKFKQQIFYPPRTSQEINYQDMKIAVLSKKCEHIIAFANQAKAHGLPSAGTYFEEADKIKYQINQLIIDKGIDCPRSLRHG